LNLNMKKKPGTEKASLSITQKREMTDREYTRKKLAPELKKYILRSGRKIIASERMEEL